MSDASSRPFSVRLPRSQVGRLDELSRLTHRSRNPLIAAAVEQFVNTEMEFIDASVQATDEALQDGAQLVPHDAVRSWLQTWGAPEEEDAAAALDELLRLQGEPESKSA